MSTQTKKSRAPRGTLSPERILQAAIRVLDSGKVDDFTMARLAAELDVKPMSLYTHFRDKDAILRAVAEELFNRIELPQSEDYGLDHLRNVMQAYFDLHIQNPVLMRLDRTWEGMTEAEARVYDELYACMKKLGLDQRSTIQMVAMLVRYAMGAAYLYPLRHKWDEDSEHWDRYRNSLGALSPERFPAVHWIWSGFSSGTQLETFEFGLDVQIGAVARYATERGT